MLTKVFWTKEEKILGVIRALTGEDSEEFQTLLMCKSEDIYYDIEDLDADKIFMGVMSDDWTITKIKRVEGDEL